MRVVIGDQSYGCNRLQYFILGYYAAGARSFYTSKPVTTVDDIKGMKIRVIPNDLFKNMM